MPGGGPGIANWAITNVCNANCDFCGYARDKHQPGDRVWIDTARACRGIARLHERGIRYLTFTGGEPTLHRGLVEMVACAAGLGMRASVVSNGFTLTPERLATLQRAGLRGLFLSVDAPTAAAHEANRGLKGVSERLRSLNAAARELGVKTVASVTLSRLVDDLDALGRFLTELGFGTVTFSYPKTEVHSSSQVFSATSGLIDYRREELAAAFQAIRDFKQRFPVLNPDPSLAEMIRHLRGEPECFPCFGGLKYFYLDPQGMVYRCDFWETPLCPVEDFGRVEFVRDGCTRCMSDCYRDASVFLNFPVAIGDALGLLGRGRPLAALRALAAPSSRASVAALIREARTLRKLARTS
jgi:MoaA/NifB/PqqE/SkfB family radical SAM enzyme